MSFFASVQKGLGFRHPAVSALREIEVVLHEFLTDRFLVLFVFLRLTFSVILKSDFIVSSAVPPVFTLTT